MGKTIAITPSWYWPAGVPRVLGVPPFLLHEMLVERFARQRPDDPALIGADGRVSAAELSERVSAASAAPPGEPPGEPLRVGASLDVESVVRLLGAFQAGAPVILGDAEGNAPPEEGALAVPGARGALWHSHASLLGGALSLAAFLDGGPGRPWLTTLPLDSWEGLYAALVPLAAGATLVLSEPGEAALDAAAREAVGTLFTSFSDAVDDTREAKRGVKSVRGLLSQIVMPARLFDPDERRRVSRQFECPALTVFGLPETGPIFVSHPSWYIDESIGIASTNVHVVPVDPRSGRPLQSLWELVESAAVSVWTPSLALNLPAERIEAERYLTGVMASSDANGMVYLLPEEAQ